MTEPLEARLLRLAEAATDEWPASGGIPVGEIDDETGTANFGDKTANLICALSAPTVILLARVVEVAREVDRCAKERRAHRPPVGATPLTDIGMARMTAEARVANERLAASLAALDASQENRP